MFATHSVPEICTASQNSVKTSDIIKCGCMPEGMSWQKSSAGLSAARRRRHYQGQHRRTASAMPVHAPTASHTCCQSWCCPARARRRAATARCSVIISSRGGQRGWQSALPAARAVSALPLALLFSSLSLCNNSFGLNPQSTGPSNALFLEVHAGGLLKAQCPPCDRFTF